MNQRLLFATSILFVSNVGCNTVGDDYVAPDLVVDSSSEWNGRFEGVITADDLDPALLATWWRSLGDPILNELITRAIAANLDIRTAASQLRQARSQRKIAAAAGAPQVGATGAGTRSGSSGSAGTGATGELFSAGIDASWELDVFGGIERGVQAADADLQAAEEARRDVLISIIAEVALNYVDLRALEAQRGIAAANLAIQESSLGVVRSKVERGASSRLDLTRAEAQAATTRSKLPVLDQQVQAVQNRLAVLLGQPPGALTDLSSSESMLAIPDIRIAVGVPAEVLRRRPDVRGAERRLAAEVARTGVAIAELYPRFSLGGSIGLESLSLSSLFDSASRAFNIGPRAQWVLFDGGRLRAQVGIQEEAQEQALIAYESAVLSALEDVENSIAAFASEQLSNQSLRVAAAASTEAARIAKLQMEAGATSFLPLLDAQRTQLVDQQALQASDAEILANLVRLYKALGGGWDPEAPAQ